MKRKYSRASAFYQHLWSRAVADSVQKPTGNMEDQVLPNFHFQKIQTIRIIITATISTGKSTLINALIGKRLARTAQGVCTGNVNFFYNKPFEDGLIHIVGDDFILDADMQMLNQMSSSESRTIASYFRNSLTDTIQVCLIDTPGVNAATNSEHGAIAQKALLQQSYDKCVCVISENNFQTVDELKHMQWLREHVPQQKLVFAFNKIDNYHAEDDIDRNVETLRTILRKVGFSEPVVCPISAKCALLYKINHYEKEVSAEDKREYADMLWKFSDPRYDLSRFYDAAYLSPENTSLIAKCGFSEFEKILFGGSK